MTSVWIPSDLHTDASPWTPPLGPLVDIAIVAGDVADGLCWRSIPWLVEHIRPRARHVIFVPGNHDLYGCRYPDEIARAREAAIAADLTLLDCGQVRLVGGIQICGGVLWTDYEITGNRAHALRVASDRHLGMNDHRRIQTRDRLGVPAPFRPLVAAGLHAEHRGRIERVLAERWDGSRIVVTHHAPHPRSLLHGEVRETIDAAYGSDRSALMEGPTAPDIWIHGHVYVSRDYVVGGTRVIANPRGHDTSFRRRDGTWSDVRENPAFNPNFTIEI